MRNFKRITATLVLLAVLLGNMATLQAAAADSYPNTHKNTGDAAQDLVAVAKTQLGYSESPAMSDQVKYCDWYGRTFAWCGIFISWCAEQAAIPTSVILKNGHVNGCASAADYNANPNDYYGGTAYDFGTYTPQPGDLFFGITESGVSTATHCGIVTGISGGYINTLEGNVHRTVNNVKNGFVYKGYYLVKTGYQYYSANKSVSSVHRLLFFVRPDYESIWNGWVESVGNWYYHVNGKNTVGWRQIDGSWYYFSGSGIMKTGWLKLDGKWYYLKEDGAMQTGWKKIDGVWYYLKSSGVMATGWQKLDGKWYYLKDSGAMQTGWKKLDGVWYYFKSSGVMKTGWLKLDGKWYYLKDSGAMLTGWLDIGEKHYWLTESGAMAADTSVTIDGIEYSFDADGVCTNYPMEIIRDLESDS